MKPITIFAALLLALLALSGCETKRSASTDQGQKAFELQL